MRRRSNRHVRKIIERNSLTPEDLESGAWREIKLRPYDVKLAAKDVYPAKIHPLRKIIEQTRRAFLEMGFAEVVSPMVESRRSGTSTRCSSRRTTRPATCRTRSTCVHPATNARRCPDRPTIVEPVRRTHEDGWETGSEGWGYTWSPERSKQVVLRTHTTAATIRALAANPNPPGKFFCVGWTYRNETISFKHLPVFHQVDGIIIDEEANLASLMGTLQEFYSKMGFGRVKFKPAFYPYTEPSVDVVVYMESRGKWLEMGGAGIFRPEVTLPARLQIPGPRLGPRHRAAGHASLRPLRYSRTVRHQSRRARKGAAMVTDVRNRTRTNTQSAGSAGGPSVRKLSHRPTPGRAGGCLAVRRSACR